MRPCSLCLLACLLTYPLTYLLAYSADSLYTYQGSANLSTELDRMARGQQQLHSWQRRTVHRLDAQAQRHALLTMAIH